jgi:uncharacterized repeat protein (TIGR03803 family)
MSYQQQCATWNCNTSLRSIIRLFCVAIIATTIMAQGQTLTVLHPFGNLPGDGANPYAGLTMDAHGDLYGTASSGGNGYGTVFELNRSGNSFVYRPLYSFQGGNDGDAPYTAVTVGPNGSIYGTTRNGGGSEDFGTVFNLQPPATFCRAVLCPWRETVLIGFNDSNGAEPYGQPIFDQAGNLYGTTTYGGYYGEGEVYELTPSNGGWTQNIIYNFGTGNGPYQPTGGVIFDHAGNLYGTTMWGGVGGYGVVYQLTPSGGSWIQTTLYSFNGGSNGGRPSTNLLMDAAGNLYGSTGWVPETNNPGTVYELTPSGGGWTHTLLYAFPVGTEGAGSVSNLVMDSAGNLYGTTSFEGNQGCSYGCGTVFKLTPSSSGWIYTDLYDFTGGSDGAWPFGGVVLDSQGNLYGTAVYGGTGSEYCLNGAGGCGTVWELTP